MEKNKSIFSAASSSLNMESQKHNMENLRNLELLNTIKQKDHQQQLLPNTSMLNLSLQGNNNNLSNLQNELSTLFAMSSKSFGSENKNISSLLNLGKPLGINRLLSPENNSSFKENNSLLINSQEKSNKSTHPIVLQNMQTESQSKSGFKLAHKPQRTEEDPAPQKKLKTINQSLSPDEVGSKKVPSLVLTSSLLKN